MPIPPVKSPPILRCDWVRAPDSEEEYAYDDPHDFIKEPPNRDEYHTLKVIVDTQRMEPQQVFLDTLNMELLHGPMEYYPRGPSTNYAGQYTAMEVEPLSTPIRSPYSASNHRKTPYNQWSESNNLNCNALSTSVG